MRTETPIIRECAPAHDPAWPFPKRFLRPAGDAFCRRNPCATGRHAVGFSADNVLIVKESSPHATETHDSYGAGHTGGELRWPNCFWRGIGRAPRHGEEAGYAKQPDRSQPGWGQLH